ncbi:MAG: TatD family hydrolase [Syntrophotaleaceae bacterium]
MQAYREILFDTHVHLDRLPTGLDPAKEIACARRHGIGQFLLPGVEPQHWRQLLNMTSTLPGCLAAPGIHPLAAQHWDEDTAARLQKLLDNPQAVAIGEIGLDGYLAHPAAEIQERAFRGQLRLARQAGLPVLLHCRKANGQLLEILSQEQASRFGGIWHAFSGSLETALAAIKLNFAIAFGGPLTWPDVRRGPQILQALPAEWIVLESDAPDLAPHPHRGETNRPAYLSLIAERVAELRGWSPEETARITTANARRVLKLG